MSEVELEAGSLIPYLIQFLVSFELIKINNNFKTMFDLCKKVHVYNIENHYHYHYDTNNASKNK